jgi:hypothetical protein
VKKRPIYVLLFPLFIATGVFGQFNEDDYKKQADEIRNEVWNSKMPFFDQRAVPEAYEKYSKVILARRQELTCLGTPKTKFVLFYGLMKQTDLTYTYIFREEVKINDEASLQDYSEISFQKFSRYLNSKRTSFLGLRVIKPDGTVKETDPDEIILTDDKEDSKRAKLAVSGLQIGDIIDYFIETLSSYSGGDRIIYNEFEFAEEDPMLHYSVHIELNNKLYAEYRSTNGAPEFKVTADSDHNIILDAQQNNIKEYPINLWLSTYRQIPMVRINIHTALYTGNRAGNNVVSMKGNDNNSPDNDILNYWKLALETYKPVAKKSLNSNREKIKKLAESYFNTNGGGTIENNSLGYYYAARHFFFLRPDKNTVAVDDLSSNYSSFESVLFLSVLRQLFNENNFDAQPVLLPSRFGPRAGEAMYSNDFALALVTNDKHIYTAHSIFDCPDQLPYYLEGQPPASLYKDIDLGEKSGYNLLASPAGNNMHTENLIVNFNPNEPQKIKVIRKAVFTGQTKPEAQKDLVTDEDYYEEERKVMGISESFIDELNSTRKGKKIESEYANAFIEICKEWKDHVKDEIKKQFNTDQADLSDCSIQQAGIFNNKPEFIYNTQFTVSAWVETAGNNYILEVGKMVTPTLRLTPEQRERNIDVYMPYARIFQYNVEIPVPDGFSIEGIDKLNTRVENTTGSFVATASLDSGKFMLHVTQTFNSAFEKADKWPELLGILDAATSFENAKILLKKL